MANVKKEATETAAAVVGVVGSVFLDILKGGAFVLGVLILGAILTLTDKFSSLGFGLMVIGTPVALIAAFIWLIVKHLVKTARMAVAVGRAVQNDSKPTDPNSGGEG